MSKNKLSAALVASSLALSVLSGLEDILRDLAGLEAVTLADKPASSFDWALLSYANLLPIKGYSVPSDIQDMLDIWADFIKENI